MKTIINVLAGLVMAAGLAGPAVAELYNPAGIWVTGTGETKFEVRLCGDGDELCGTLIWLGEGGREELRQFVNQPLMDTARRVGNQKWRGEVFIFGRHLKGSVEISTADRLVIKGCDGVLCESITLYRSQR